MQILFTKNSSPLSWLIRFGLDEPCSHMALELDGKLIFHSNLIGVHIRFAENFKKENQVVGMIGMNLTADEENEVYYKAIALKEGKPYDFLGLLYFIWRGFLLKFFQKPLPAYNRFQIGDAYLCTEMVNCLPKRILDQIKLTDVSMVSAWGVYRAFVASRSKKLAG